MPLCWLVVVICSYLYRHLEVVIFGHIFLVFLQSYTKSVRLYTGRIKKMFFFRGKVVILSYIQKEESLSF